MGGVGVEGRRDRLAIVCGALRDSLSHTSMAWRWISGVARADDVI
jgi:hypothetical protein